MGHMVERAQIIVRGVVQGVGFRPHVYSLAGDLGLKGYVANTADGVFIDIEGQHVAEFVKRLSKEAPPLSRITDLSVTSLPYNGYADFTIQKSTDDGESRPFTLVSPDVSICGDCLKELLDPCDRRYLYPFINCTNCGPRYSITRSIPYDRPNTTMAGFTMCPECLSEYNDPRNRRFHAQPNACAACGPQMEFRMRNAKISPSPNPSHEGRGMSFTSSPLVGEGRGGGDALMACIQLLRRGGIVAIKGLGGFHIACDAMNDDAVKRLRANKRKSNKPFAAMVPSVEAAEQFCWVSKAERKLLISNRRPIVLLRKKHSTHHAAAISGSVAPNNQYIGCMLPYTPLHYLLFHHPDIKKLLVNSALRNPHSALQALVMTSGNISEEPIVRDNDEAIKKLSGIVDAFLLHDRDIFMRVDDSVVRVASVECGMRSAEYKIKQKKRSARFKHSELHTPNSTLMFIRRSRGYAPDPIPLHAGGPEVLGCGADLKNTFTLTKGAFAVPSQHIGDMENYETLKFFEESLENLKSLYRVNPVAIVHDLHPGYLSTRWAMEQGSGGRGQKSEEKRPPSPNPLPSGERAGVRGNSGLRTEPAPECFYRGNSALERFALQHHYAHIGSVMAENGLRNNVIGVAFDGTGYGTDGNLWGGEFLIAGIEEFERAGQFKYIPLPGGESAIREPWRTAVSYILDAAGERAGEFLERIGFVKKYGEKEIEKITTVIPLREFSPLSSGAGRLFDAVSAMLGLCDRNTFEGEAAIALESLVDGSIDNDYPVEFKSESGYSTVDFSKTILGILEDTVHGKDKKIIATQFHNTIATAIVAVTIELSKSYGLTDVALSGGTFQNLYLLNRTVRLLKSEGMNVFFNQKVPSNDAGISLGQAYIVRERLKNAECGFRNAE